MGSKSSTCKVLSEARKKQKGSYFIFRGNKNHPREKERKRAFFRRGDIYLKNKKFKKAIDIYSLAITKIIRILEKTQVFCLII